MKGLLFALLVCALVLPASAATVKLVPGDSMTANVLTLDVTTQAGGFHRFRDGANITATAFVLGFDGEGKAGAKLAAQGGTKATLGILLDSAVFLYSAPSDSNWKGFVGLGWKATAGPINLRIAVATPPTSVRDAGLFVVGSIPL